MHSPITLLAFALICATTNVTAAPQLKPVSRAKAAAAATPAAASCPAMILVFARGTTETGDLGSIVGPPLQTALNKEMPGKAVVMGVPAPAYAADVPGFLAGGSATGSKAMAQMAQDEMKKCPKSTVVLSGYSQGGQLVHNAAKMIPPASAGNMMAVIFGDPNNGTAVAGVPAANTLVVCHAADNICQHGDLILPAHLSYGSDTGTAAKFLAGKMAAAPKAATRDVYEETEEADDEEEEY